MLSLGIAGTIGAPFLMHLTDIDFFTYILNETIALFENINIGNIFIYFKTLFNDMIFILKSIDTNLLINAIIAFVTFFAVYGLLGGLSELAVIDCLNSNMSSKTRLSYFKSLISKMFKSFTMKIVKFFMLIPYIICIALLFYYSFMFYDTYGGLAKVLIPFLLFLSFVLITGFYVSLNLGFAPSIIVNGEGVFKSLKRGFCAIKKKYFRVLSTSIMIIFILTIFNLFFSVFSFFAGLILTLPITILVINLFELVSYYECNGMRYYVGDTIRTPLKVCEQDKIKKIKYIV